MMARVLFLFNHDAAHQVAHLAGIAAATARRHPDLAVLIAYATPAIRQRIEGLIPAADAARLHWHHLDLPGWMRRAVRPLDRLAPASRLARLRRHRDLFASVDVLVSTERTCLKLKGMLPADSTPLFVRVPHGSGDRSVTFHPDQARFDMVLLTGRKMAEQFAQAGVMPPRHAIIGYSKFEQVDTQARPDFFGNGRPTFLYNPHFDPYLSSWYRAGPQVLRWFAGPEGRRFNLIFAPHVMLFRKRVHISPEYRRIARRPPIPREACVADNILIDVEGPRLFDMSYTLGSDAYIGDASSQVYEFLIRPRPVFTLDPRGALARQGAAALPFLTTGPVARSVDKLIGLLPDHAEIGALYRPVQEALMARTFDRGAPGAPPPSDRAADAIAGLVHDRRRPETRG